MNILVTAGNTLTPIDRVRGITNIFTGRTGAQIAGCAWDRGHCVTLLTSHPETVPAVPPAPRGNVRAYRTFDDLEAMMAEEVRKPGLNVIIHCAAVSDYRSAGIYAPASQTRFDESELAWKSDGPAPQLVDMAAGKVKSDAEELWLRLARTPKLVDRVRGEWGFRGTLVKFKLEVGVDDERLLEIAERSRVHSSADLMVANTLEDSQLCAYVGPLDGMYHRITRHMLATRLVEIVEELRGEKPPLEPIPGGSEAAVGVPASAGLPAEDRLKPGLQPEASPLPNKLLLGVTGSVAAILTPALYGALKANGYQVKVVATPSALYFFDPSALDPTRAERNPDVVILDEDEWPGRTEGKHWQRGDPVLHIELRRWADLLLIAPLDANTLAKLANGLSDNCLTCVWRAWDAAKPRVLVPAMNTLMWENPLTLRHLRQLAADDGLGDTVPSGGRDGVIDWINRICPSLRIVPPQSKRLACGDVGDGAMASLEEIVAVVDSALSH